MWVWSVIVGILALGVNEINSQLPRNKTNPAKGIYSETFDKLQQFLLKDYDRYSPPFPKQAKTLTVYLDPVIQHIQEVNEIEQTISLHGYIFTTWTDDRLRWNSSLHGGLVKTLLPGWSIWTPTLLLANSAQGDDHFTAFTTNYVKYVIRNYGKVQGAIKFSFKFTCVFDYSNYPYDSHVCPAVITDTQSSLIGPFDLQSFYSDNAMVRANFIPESDVDIGDALLRTSGWILEEAPISFSYYLSGEGLSDKKPEINVRGNRVYYKINLKLKRYSPYFGLTVVLPAALTGLITASVFWINNSVFGIYISLLNLLLQGLFMRDVLLLIPATTNTAPKIITFYGLNLSLTTIALLLLFVLKGLSRITQPLSPILLPIAHRITNFTWIRVEGKLKKESSIEVSSEEEAENETRKLWPVISEFCKLCLGSLYLAIYFIIMIIFLG